MEILRIGEIIKAKRRERELTQEELANVLGVTKAAVSKWENAESYPDIEMLPQIAEFFHITMDELFGYTLKYKPLKIVNQYSFGLSPDDFEDTTVFDHGKIEACDFCKSRRMIGGKMVEDLWETRIHMTSTEENFPYILQEHIKQGRMVEGFSVRLADDKIIDDGKPNKHYVCKEKVWEYNNNDIKYVRQMLKEQLAMGLIEDGGDI